MQTIEMLSSANIGRAVVGYLGVPIRDLDVVADPQVPGCYAIQVVAKGMGTVQFLLRGVPAANVVAGDLEEVEFTTWPPKMREFAK